MTSSSHILSTSLLIYVISRALCDTYNQTSAIHQDRLTNDHYNTDVRPVKNQSATVPVYVSFDLLSIVKVDDVAQSFICNGFFVFVWRDEILAWDPADYGGQKLVHPLPGAIWRPRVILLNTLGDRDIFDDEHKAPVSVYSNGFVYWMPGSVFPVSCELNMEYYPFDIHTCSIQVSAMTFFSHEMRFISLPTTQVGTTYFTTNGEWILQNSSLSTSYSTTSMSDLAEVKVSFTILRRPYFLLLNIVLPVVFLSLLNILVFAIPVESGEKIGYGITVLLALSVFMSIVSGMLPRSSTMPKVTIYLFILFIISVLTVIDSIFIVFLYHMEEKEDKHQKAQENYKRAFSKVRLLHRVVATRKTSTNIGESIGDKPVTIATVESKEEEVPPYSPDTSSDAERKVGRRVNKYRLIGKYIDLVSFICFFLVWFGVTLGFMFDLAL